MRLMLLCLLLIGFIAACYSPVGSQVPGGDGEGIWSYGSGPNGEHCLFYSKGWGQSQMVAMECDSVNWEQ